MLSQIGFTFLFIAFISNIVTIISYKINKDFFKEKIFYYSVYFACISIIVSFFSLMGSFVTSDFSNFNVFQNSHSSNPLLYKITATWGNHEGSMLLWLLIMSLYTSVFSFNNSLSVQLRKLTIVFQSLLFLGFCSFVILTSNPFLINSLNVNEGLGFNPILQDPALAIHPPVLYTGYVGFSLILSLALSGLITGEIGKEWSNVTKKWAMFCWTMLTGGIALGAYWAYYELGWGGWWFWDPVENVSLMPWIAGLALVHSLMIVNQDQLLKRWIIFLSILCFSLSIMGTFLVRSGILTSVHAFATDSSRGIFILLLFLIITGFSFLLLIIKSPEKNERLNLLLINKTTALVINNLIMIIACATVLLGTLYPIIIEVITNKRISVGPPYYNATVLPILLPGLMLMSVAPALSWQTNKLVNARHYVYIFTILSILVIVINYTTNFSVWGFVGILTGLWIICASIYSFTINYKNSINKKILKFFLKNNALIAHIGVGILILGITFSSVYQLEYQKNIKVNEKFIFGKYELNLNSLDVIEKDNFQSLTGNFSLFKGNKLLSKIMPEKRYYYVSKIITTEAGIYHHPLQDFYLILGDQKNDTWSIKIYQNPLVSLIWLGVLIMVCAGILGLSKR